MTIHLSGVIVRVQLSMLHAISYTLNITSPEVMATMSLLTRDELGRLARGARQGFISVERATHLLDASPKSAAARLASLARRGWLARVRRGLYLILPLEAKPSGTAAVEDSWILAQELFAPCYIAGWSAAEHWGLTEQIFRSTFVATAAHVRRRHFGLLTAEFRVVRVKADRVKAASLVWRGRERVAVSDRERTIADALVSPDWVGGIRHLTEIFSTYRRSESWEPRRLFDALRSLDRGAAFKRLGYLLEASRQDCPELVTACLERRTEGFVKLDPSIAAKGRLNRRWGLALNALLPKPGDEA
ncbi:MAG: hypothetical protein HZA54_19180 [Planctomycetes bacterium]|nr:hypothetical protein [Planctomycetota bacterium]